MPKLAEQLDSALRAANVPILGVAIGRETDRGSWRVDYAPEATGEQRMTGAGVLASFTPTDPAVAQRTLAAEAQQVFTKPVQAFALAYLRDKLNREPTKTEREGFRALIVQAAKDIG